ncbi:DUF2269 family protein [Rubellimicrobium aerolatum]|uniref:DUF2269 family protein n=1 Tax=Rubellimicrobium aerolatum TaxID=490979 RepID=A0ABW0SDS2_9RHOB|nr:DUF2269 family protein [Rubellimicrobium aerolatum]MBP1805757.1 putative membrane protein [Rubellimicrobium aerolatum]
MDFQDILRLLHLGALTVWIGGGLGLVVLSAAATGTHDDQHALRIIKGATILGPVLTVPAALAVLASGLLLVWAGSHPWEAWLTLSLLGTGVTFAVGALRVGPLLERAALVWERDGDEAQALRLGCRALRIARIDQVILFALLAINVLQPGWEDRGLLLTLAVAAAVAALLALRPAPGTAAAS